MCRVVLQVTNSPFNEEQVALINQLLPTLTDAQKIWLSGYLAALCNSAAATGAVAQTATAQPAAAPNQVAIPKEATILYGSQTGNSQRLANRFAGKLKEQGFAVDVFAMNDFKTNNLKKVRHLFIIVSTHGEGDPPDNAVGFYEFLHSKRAPKLDGMPFGVLALGDTSYEFFCQTGKDFDKRLEELGGKRIVDRTDCDVDFEEAAEEWMNRALAALAEIGQQAGAPAGGQAGWAATGSAVVPAQATEYSRSNPFHATVLENLNLNGRGSKRETRHLELSLEGSGIQYEPGDSLGLYPENHPRLVQELIGAMKWNPDEPVTLPKGGGEAPLRDVLTRHVEITVLTKPLLEQVAELAGNSRLRELVAPGREQELKAYLAQRDLLDLIRDFNLEGLPARELVPLLRKLPPRLYSISSSPLAYPDEVHLTIRKVEYEAHGRKRFGVASTHVAERVKPGDTLPVFVQSNPNFKLPADPDTPIIMIGPGTGVAPFRAFLGHREETGAKGKSWLFFGDQHFRTDFLYQVEWQRWLKDGVLTRMDVAFSRDTDRKIYVQHRMLEKSKDLYAWLEEGAVVYVCGDEKRMAHDVHETLLAILEQEGGLSPEQAAERLLRMQQERRYQRDVY